jgi:D-tyrosyl-tRNA(Tyr) deacylase
MEDMKTVIQRVSHARVTIDGKVHGEIGQGYLILAGFCDEDDERIVQAVGDKIARLRIFPDENGRMNLSLGQVQGSILSISQFTLYADTSRGNRPSFTGAGRPEHASSLYTYFNAYMRKLGFEVQEGIFGADMKVDLCNDGPVTILLDSENMKIPNHV